MFSLKCFYNPWKVTSTTRKQTFSPWFVSCSCLSAQKSVLNPSNKLQGAANKHQLNREKKKRKTPCQPVLECFDQQYSRELGALWTSVRAVLLNPPSWQYGVMLNRFTAVLDLTQSLESQGFFSVLPQTEALLCDRPLNHPECILGTLSDDSNLQSDFRFQSSQSQPSHSSSLQCYIHPYPVRFPSQAHRPGHLKQYYLLNAASLLPVLALQVKDGENILDLCSAPGGKAVAITQSCNPARLCCNEPDPHRRDWLAKTLESFLPPSLNSSVIVSAEDGSYFGQSEPAKYDKVLVDAPCSNDRSWLYAPGGQQGEHRLRERMRLPALQAQLVKSALSAVRPGGSVVYSTCTLSSYENYSVVESVLKDCPEAEPEDLWEELAVPFSKFFCFSRGLTAHVKCGTVSPHNSRLGIVVVPYPGKTWGPMFVSRIRRRMT